MLAKKQINDISKWVQEKYIPNFIHDINNWDKNINILSYYKNSMLYGIYNPNFDMDFYGTYHADLKHMTHKELARHYKRYGKLEGRLICK